MTNEIAMSISGILFLFILVTLATSVAFGKTIGEFDSDDKLKKIIQHPKKF